MERVRFRSLAELCRGRNAACDPCCAKTPIRRSRMGIVFLLGARRTPPVPQNPSFAIRNLGEVEGAPPTASMTNRDNSSRKMPVGRCCIAMRGRTRSLVWVLRPVRLVCSAGVRPARAKVRSPVVRMAGWRGCPKLPRS
jgi:hypothetical protein